MAKFKFYAYVGNDGQEKTVEIPDEDLEGLEGAARDKVIAEYLDRWLEKHVETGWEEVEEREL